MRRDRVPIDHRRPEGVVSSILLARYLLAVLVRRTNLTLPSKLSHKLPLCGGLGGLNFQGKLLFFKSNDSTQIHWFQLKMFLRSYFSLAMKSVPLSDRRTHRTPLGEASLHFPLHKHSCLWMSPPRAELCEWLEMWKNPSFSLSLSTVRLTKKWSEVVNSGVREKKGMLNVPRNLCHDWNDKLNFALAAFFVPRLHQSQVRSQSSNQVIPVNQTNWWQLFAKNFPGAIESWLFAVQNGVKFYKISSVFKLAVSACCSNWTIGSNEMWNFSYFRKLDDKGLY